MYSLIVTAKMNDVDPQAWLADALARLADTPLSRLPELLPWNWKREITAKAAVCNTDILAPPKLLLASKFSLIRARL